MNRKQLLSCGCLCVLSTAFGRAPASPWTCVYGTAEGVEGEALALLESKLPAAMPKAQAGYFLEDGGSSLLLIGRPQNNHQLDIRLRGRDLPTNGYFIRTVNERGGRRVIILCGDTPGGVLRAVNEFTTRALTPSFLAEERVPAYERHVSPKRNWQCAYAPVEGPEGKALAVLTERLTALALRDPGKTTSHVLPMVRAGRDPADDLRDLIVVGTPQTNPTLAAYLKGEKLPKGGYLVRTLNESTGRRVVLLAGDTPAAALWAALEFADLNLDAKFLESPVLPAIDRRTAPETEVRSLFTWGHVIDDYRLFFRECARMRLNRILLWNEYPPVNAAEVVREAHAWGLAVYWSFSWGWIQDCGEVADANVPKLIEATVAEWHRVWEPLKGDGIYFQTFTERKGTELNGNSVTQLAVEVVNGIARRIRAESPGVDIVFGLHSDSVKTEPKYLKPLTPETLAALPAENARRLAEIERTDEWMEILWENCGGYPFSDVTARPDVAFVDKILASKRPVGLSWKAQVRQDWSCWAHQAGPYVLGEAGAATLARDRALTAEHAAMYDENARVAGPYAWEMMRHVRGGDHPPKEINLVPEYNPPFTYATVLQAELAWGSSEPWEAVRIRAEARTKAGQALSECQRQCLR